MGLDLALAQVRVRADLTGLGPDLRRATRMTRKELQTLSKLADQGLIGGHFKNLFIPPRDLAPKAAKGVREFTKSVQAMNREIHRAADLKGMQSPGLSVDLLRPMDPLILPRFTELDRQLARITESYSYARRPMQGFTADMRTMGNAIPTVNGHMASLVKTMGLFAGIGAFASIIKSGEEFNQKMNQSMAIMEDLTKMMKEDMVDAAMLAASTTRFSAAQSAEAFFFLASAGLTANQAIKAMPAVARFAQAGNFDLARATSLAADAQAAMGMKMKDPIENLKQLTRVTDVLVKANTLANATTEEFALSITRKAGAAARIVGKDIEELTATVAAYAQQGTKGFNAGQAMNIVFRDLQTKALKNAESFKRLGVEVFDTSGEMNNMADIVEDLEDLMLRMSDAERKAVLMSLGLQDKSLIYLQTLIGTSQEIRRFEKELRKAGGTTEKVANKQLTPFQKSMAKLGAATTKLGRLLMESLIPSLANISSAMVYFVETVGSGLGPLLKLSISLGAAALAMKVAAIAIGAYERATLLAARATFFLVGASRGLGAVLQIGLGVAAATAAITFMNVEMAKAEATAQETASGISDLSETEMVATDTTRELGESFDILEDKLEGLSERASSFVRNFTQLKTSLEGTEQIVAGLTVSFTRIASGMELSSEAVKHLTRDLSGGILEGLSLEKAVMFDTKPLEDMKERLEKSIDIGNLGRRRGDQGGFFPSITRFAGDIVNVEETLRNIQKIEDEIASVESLKKKYESELPPVEEVNKALTEQRKELEERLRTFQSLSNLPGVLGKAGKEGEAEVSKLLKQLGSLEVSMEDYGNTELPVTRRLAILREGLKAFRDRAEDARKALPAILGPLEAIEKAFKGNMAAAGSFLQKLENGLTTPQEKYKEFLRQLEEIRESLVPGAYEIGLELAAKELDEAVGSPLEKLKDMNDELYMARAGLSELEKAAWKFGDALEARGGDTSGAGGYMAKTHAAMDKFKSIFKEQKLRDMGASLEKSLRTPGEKLEDSIRDWKALLDLAPERYAETYKRALESERDKLVKDEETKAKSGGRGFTGYAELGRKIQEALLKDPEEEELEKHTSLLERIALALEYKGKPLTPEATEILPLKTPLEREMTEPMVPDRRRMSPSELRRLEPGYESPLDSAMLDQNKQQTILQKEMIQLLKRPMVLS